MVSSSDVKRLFLQSLLSRGIVSEALCKALYAKSIEAVKNADNNLNMPYSNTNEAFDEVIKDINASLNDLDLELKSIQDELSGRRLYALVNTKDDELAQVATDYTPAEIVFFKAIIEQIMLARNESFSLSSLAALREVSAIKPKSNMSKTQAETVLASFVAKGWLLRSKRCRYSLSPRTLLELYPYLKSTYDEELLYCTICHDVVTKGVACHRPNCKARLHFHCFKLYRRGKGKCPSCEIDWPRQATDDPLGAVGEGAVRDGDDGKRRVKIRQVDDDEEDEEMEPGSSQPSQPSQPSRSQKNKKSTKKKAVADSEEEDEDEEIPTQEDSPPPRRRSSRR
ncbi:hypothetical protein K435DRAFT_763328 [Dendrothele bispora CBS 962.96]|uniref:Non-structural maintenance of chromosomes element 1 homolog n=1 Tax=Dendrothele bispora (strain CBS 962.96) TaxID=1314807 RepID=A0A4S8LC09_DENBC|nr:hypothetical protein K435DRAFT_763328 [Dendrothele bispora CBS 962.96]